MSLFSSNNAGDPTQGLSQVRQELYHCTTRPVLDFCFQMSCLSLPFANKPTFCVVLQEESKKDQEDRSGFHLLPADKEDGGVWWGVLPPCTAAEIFMSYLRNTC